MSNMKKQTIVQQYNWHVISLSMKLNINNQVHENPKKKQ